MDATTANGDATPEAQVHLFAQARQMAGCEYAPVHCPLGSTVADIKQSLAERYPQLEQVLPHCLFAVNEEYAGPETPVASEDHIACFPPVSGG